MNGPRLGYLLKKFPRLSETFVLNEILGQERLGARLHVFSRRPPDDEPRHPQLRGLRAETEVLPPSRQLDPWSELFRSEEDSGSLLQDLQRLMSGSRECMPPKFPSLVAEALHLRRRCRELSIDHLHVHFATDSAVTAMLLRALGGPTYSVTAHAKDIYRSTVNPELLDRILSHSAFSVTVCDANVRHVRALVGEKAAGRVRRLYNGVDLDAFSGNGARESGHILAVGRLVEKKGFHLLIEAMETLRSRGVSCRATLVGEGDMRGTLEAQIAELDLEERVQITGSLGQDQVSALMARATLLCLPCLVGNDGNRDALPTVLLEAQAAGLPVVSTPVTGIPEILGDGATGLLVPENDSRATADAIEALLSDEKGRQALAASGRARAERLFDSERNARVLHDWFREVLARTVPC